MLVAHKASGTLASISLWEVEASHFGVADFDSTSTRIRRFRKNLRAKKLFNLINTGTYLLEPEVFDRMPQGIQHGAVVFPVLAEEGGLSGFPFEGHFVDAGTPPSYIEAVQTSIEGAWVRGNSGNNWFGNGVVVDSTSKVSGSAVVLIAILETCNIVSSALLNSVSVGSAPRYQVA